jgi:hypothetical protein
MLVTQQPVLRRFWYPVMPLDHLANGPQSFTLLGQSLVLWLTDRWHPRCPGGSVLPPFGPAFRRHCQKRLCTLPLPWVELRRRGNLRECSSA